MGWDTEHLTLFQSQNRPSIPKLFIKSRRRFLWTRVPSEVLYVFKGIRA